MAQVTKPVVPDAVAAAKAIAEAQVASAAAAAALKSQFDAATKPTQAPTNDGKILTLQYRVLNDGIIAGDEQQALGINVLTGLVTRGDIENAGADFAWLLKIGALEEVGYA